jgi:molecular chaperone GrpE
MTTEADNSTSELDPEGAAVDGGGESGAERDADFSKLGKMEDAALIEKLRSDMADYKDKYLRALAELENYKKRAMKERSDLIKYQGDRILADLLQVVDNLELALQHSGSDPQKLRAGVELTHKLFVDTLGRWGIKSENGVGQQFDPNRFLAVSKIAVNDAVPGTIIQEMRKTYFYKDKLLRAGEVVVAAEAEVKDEAGDQGAAKDSE